MAALCQVPGAQGPASVACLAPRPGAPLEASLSLFWSRARFPQQTASRGGQNPLVGDFFPGRALV